MKANSHRLSWLVIIVLCIACTGVTSAQVWKSFEFAVDERYEYRVESVEYDYDSTSTSAVHFYTVDIRNTGRLSPNGDPLLNVSTTTLQAKTSDEISEGLMWSSLLGSGGLGLGNPFEFMFLLPAMQELDFEVGERTNIFGIGRVSVTERVTVAGRNGVLIRFETGDAGDRKLSSEWAVDTKLALPLIVRSYDDEGRLKSETTLEKYVRY